MQKEGKKALDMFNELLKKHPKNPHILHAKAKALDTLAEQQRSNKFLGMFSLEHHQSVSYLVDMSCTSWDFITL